jgi:multiple sugar transport system permease protein
VTHARTALGAATAALLLGGLVLGVALAVGAVRTAEHDLLRAEAAAAVALFSEAGGPEPLERLVPGRWSVTAASPADALDRPRVEAGPDGPRARAALYGIDGWTPAGTLELAAADPPIRPPLALLLLAVVSGLALVGVALAWAQGGAARGASWTGGHPPSWAPGLLSALLLAVPLASSARWSEARLTELTDARLALGTRTLAAAPDPGAVRGRAGGVAGLTGLSFVERGAEGEVVASNLLGPTARALVTLEPPRPERVTLGRATWAVAAAGPVVLARVPYEQVHRPVGALLAVVLVAPLLAGIPMSLTPLLDRRRALRRNLVAWAFLAPAAAHLAVFTLGPLAFALWLSLHEWTLVDPARPFVGLGNYADLLRDGPFWNAIRNTVVFTLHVPVAMAIALGFALLVHRRTRGVLAVRAALFLPSITSLVAIAVVWQWMLNDQYGLLNWALGLVGLDPVRWLTSPRTALLSIMLLSTWMVVGYQMVLFQAGLAAIPTHLYEAARIDGAGAWRRFVHVTLPGLRHTLFFVLVTSVIGSFQVFGAVYVMTQGGPLRSTDVAVYHIYQEAWDLLRFGRASAMSWVLFLLVFAVTWLHFRLLERRAEGAG